MYEKNPDQEPERSGLDYSSYGSSGKMIQQLHIQKWNLRRERWKKQAPPDNELSLDEALAKCLNRSGYWFYHLMLAAMHLEAFSPSEFASFWEAFRNIFDPCLCSLDEVSDWAIMEQRGRLMHIIGGKSGLDSIDFRYWQVKEATYSAYSAREIAYMLEKHPDIIEVGTGSGILLDVINRGGGRAIGIESGRYVLDLAKRLPWTRELMQRRLLIRGGLRMAKKYARTRMAVNSAPLPGSSIPAKVLEILAANGGEYFMFKPGIFMMPWHPRLKGRENSIRGGKNIRRFFEQLLHWREVSDPDRPSYDPLAEGDNSWFFRLHEKPSPKPGLLGQLERLFRV